MNSKIFLSIAILVLLHGVGAAADEGKIQLPTTEVGKPFAAKTIGLTMFRGNPTRSFYGTGPLPTTKPRKLWRYPDKPLCSSSTALGETKTWCGSGWTGQPVVWERPDGITEIIVGAYDRAVHFINAETGKDSRPPFMTGDIIKGSVTLDPDGFPLLYFGSRDNKLRILALDQPVPTEIWHVDGHTPDRVWNDDWDGNPVVINDHLIEGGENSWFYVYKLNRKYTAQGKVTVNPQQVVRMKGWTDQLLRDVGDKSVSIESSVAVQGNKAYFTNSGGLITGVNLDRVKDKQAEIFFRFWAGDDIDASPIIDKDGSLYVAVEYERKLDRAKQMGQVIKLNPENPGNPVVWSFDLTKLAGDGKGGVWATPTLDADNHILYVPTHTGFLIAIDTRNGAEMWRAKIGNHEWSSPALIEQKLLVGLCEAGGLVAYDVKDPKNPTPMWTVKVGGCIESSPAVWKGRFYVGSRDGYIYGFGE